MKYAPLASLFFAALVTVSGAFARDTSVLILEDNETISVPRHGSKPFFSKHTIRDGEAFLAALNNSARNGSWGKRASFVLDTAIGKRTMNKAEEIIELNHTLYHFEGAALYRIDEGEGVVRYFHTYFYSMHHKKGSGKIRLITIPEARNEEELEEYYQRMENKPESLHFHPINLLEGALPTKSKLEASQPVETQEVAFHNTSFQAPALLGLGY